MKSLDRALGLLLAAAALAAIVWASNAPMTVHGSEHGVLRLAWSARPERIEVCREQTAEELANVPQHMRQPVVCEGASAQYRLSVLYAGNVVADRQLQGGGLRHDRRLYVFEEIPLEPGDASIEVRFDRLDSEGPRPPAVDMEIAPTLPGRGETPQVSAETVPPRLSFELRLKIRPRQVVLVTYSPEQRRLIAVQDDRAAVPGQTPQ